MSVPTHKDDCKTSLYQTLCPDCRDTVFFFSCTRGSRVFFDLPQPPWNPHEERCIQYLIRFLKDVEKMSAMAIRDLVEKYAKERGLAVPRDVRQRLIADENRSTGRTTVLDVLPASAGGMALGTILQINQTNIFRRARIPKNAMGRALIGKLADQSLVEVVIREDRDPGTGFANQFTFFVELRRWDSLGLRLGAIAVAVLRDHQLSVGKHVWIAESIERGTAVRRPR
jgi:hypothetical protein